jgi:hypothetical protein
LHGKKESKDGHEIKRRLLLMKIGLVSMNSQSVSIRPPTNSLIRTAIVANVEACRRRAGFSVGEFKLTTMFISSYTVW